MKVKEVYVTREKLSEVFSIIEDALSTSSDTQIFVDNRIFEILKNYGFNYHIYLQNYSKGFHYNHNENGFGGEEWLALSEGCFFDKIIARASFIDNSKEYMQVAEFHSKKVVDYTHYLEGFNNLLLILFNED